MKNIALGQYYPSNSVIHRLDGRTKILLAVVFIVFSFFCKTLASFLFLTAITLTVVLLSRIPLSVILRSLKAIIFILLFTFVINVFFTKSDNPPLVSWWIFEIYEEGLWNAGFVVIRILCLIIGSTLFISYTTTPIQLTYSIESLLSPLKRIKVPVHDFAMMMSIVLRFIPALSEETDKIITAQKSRGADFESGSVFRRVKALIPVLVPLFISAFRRSDELATAMECRCYHGGDGRTKMTVSRMHFSDYAALFIMVIGCVALLSLNYLEFGYSL